MKTKKIAIDARFFGPQQKGLGRYAQKLVEYLEKIDGNCSEREYYILLRQENYNLFQPKTRNFKKILADYHWYTFAEQFLFPWLLYKYKFDLVHFTHFNVPLLYRKKFIVTIHDLILFHYPTIRNTTLNRYFYWLKLWAYRRVINSAAKRATEIIAVSEHTRKDIIKNLKVLTEKVSMIYEGCEPLCYIPTQSKKKILKKYGIMKPYIIYVGNAYPHKNLERLVLAYDEVLKNYPDLKLILVGKKDYFYSRLENFIKSRNIKGVILPGYVPDEDLDTLFREAELYVFPSLFEGFGLPPLEAMTKGTPVISSNLTSMPEILGNTVGYFDPESIQSITEKIIWGVKEGRNTFSFTKVMGRVEKFNWKEMAKKTLALYQKH